jgi:hypothetical protein
VLFASLMLVIGGAFNVIEGLVALFKDGYFVVRENGLLVFDFTVWGWIMLLFGALMIVVGLALNGARGWARIVAVVLVGLNAVAQVAFMSASPVWSVLVIALDVLVIFALTARWDVAVAGMQGMPEYASAPDYDRTRPPMMPRG